jgi:hypothetical protein
MASDGYASKSGLSRRYVFLLSLFHVQQLQYLGQNLTNLSLQRKYSDASEFAICSLIGGFFFLRFVNPAIVMPQAYMLVESVPGKHPRRTLTLVCLYLSIMYWQCSGSAAYYVYKHLF